MDVASLFSVYQKPNEVYIQNDTRSESRVSIIEIKDSVRIDDTILNQVLKEIPIF